MHCLACLHQPGKASKALLPVTSFERIFGTLQPVGMQAGAVFWNGRGDGDVRIGLFIEQQLADNIRSTTTETHILM